MKGGPGFRCRPSSLIGVAVTIILHEGRLLQRSIDHLSMEAIMRVVLVILGALFCCAIDASRAGAALADTPSARLPCGVLAGSVCDTAGRPVAGATVIVRGTTPLRGVVAGRDGSYRITGIPPGAYGVHVMAVGFPRDTGSVVVIERDEVSTLDITPRGGESTAWALPIRTVCRPPIQFGSSMKVQSISGDELGRSARGAIHGAP